MYTEVPEFGERLEDRDEVFYANGYPPESKMLDFVGEYCDQVLSEVFRFERVPDGANVDDGQVPKSRKGDVTPIEGEMFLGEIGEADGERDKVRC